jgi:predicted RNase H-like HicB family nuclease
MAAPHQPAIQSAVGVETVNLQIETELETDGRWIARIPDMPGVLAYGSNRATAVAAVQSLALRVLADRIQTKPVTSLTTVSVSFACA